MRTEHFLVGDAACARRVQRLDDGARIAGSGNRGYAGGEAVADAPTGGGKEVVVGEGGLERNDPADPVGKVGLMDGARQAGQLEMRVGVDEAGEDDAVGEVFRG